MSDEKEFPVQPPDPGSQLPAPEEPAGQLEPPRPGEETVIQMPAVSQTPEPVEEPIPPAEEPPATAEAVVTPPPTPQAPVKKNNRTIWIIVIIVLVLLCCCCLLIIGLAVLGFLPVQDQLQYWYLLPKPAPFV